MTKAWQTGPRPIALRNGATLRNGQIIGGEPMLKNPQRPLNSVASDHNLARSGAPKRVQEVIPPAAPNMRRQSGDSVYTGPGQKPVDDEKEPPIKSYTVAPAIAHGMVSRADRGEHKEGLGNAILTEASNLGRKA
jgi:hypothetical protein